MNCFSLGAQIGGQTSREADAQEQALRDIFNHWSGEYSDEIREFAFILRIDGHIKTYTQIWNIVGAQRAKRKRDWIEVEIGVPEVWWREASTDAYKKRLAGEIEKGLLSMIDLLRASRCEVKEELLLSDWRGHKAQYLATSTDAQPHASDGVVVLDRRSSGPRHVS